jgi:hypothetical protein
VIGIALHEILACSNRRTTESIGNNYHHVDSAMAASPTNRKSSDELEATTAIAPMNLTNEASSKITQGHRRVRSAISIWGNKRSETNLTNEANSQEKKQS